MTLRKRLLCIFNRNDTTLLPLQEEKKIIPCPVIALPMGDHHNSVNERSLHFELLVSSDGLTLHLQQPLPSLYFHLLFLWTCVWFIVRMHVLNCKPLLILNKLIFGEISGYLFKVNSTHSLPHSTPNPW